MTNQEVVDAIVRRLRVYCEEHGTPNRFLGAELARDIGVPPLRVGAVLSLIAPFSGLLPFHATVDRGATGTEPLGISVPAIFGYPTYNKPIRKVVPHGT